MLNVHGRDLAAVFPLTAQASGNGMSIGGCDLADLAHRFGTPLYVFDEVTLRAQLGAFRDEFRARYPDVLPLYASKAYVGFALLRILQEEGYGLDVVSGGELAFARAVGYPVETIYFHGNNKTPHELAEALATGIGRYVVDNFYELDTLDRLAGEQGVRAKVLLRVSPGIDPHTHHKTTTGIVDSKFGFTIANGQASEALRRAAAAPNLDLIGIHSHLGSPIFEIEPYVEAIDVVLDFIAAHRDVPGFRLDELSPGGGFAIQYLADTPPPTPADYAEGILPPLCAALDGRQLGRPRLFIEPGRAIVGRAGVALYTAGARKEIPGVRTYVSVDGGMADNIRPALYDSRYEVAVVNRLAEPASETVTIAGKYCESGDLLAQNVALPAIEAGDLVAMPAAGAYAPAMASNYNMAVKPAIVLVRDGEARLIRRRETYEDLMRCELAD
ncbi:MAG: diaminopimelate decarboxylase [Dehalococcoidia bacterium]|nr:MAG: diaminopimelate decarboxylase [Dehalococcoidia bacterium]